MGQVDIVQTPAKHPTALGTTSMVLGILSLVLFVAPYFGLPLAITALVMSSFQRTKDKRANQVVLGRTTSGLIMGIIGIIINLVMGIVALIALMIAMHTR